MGLIGGVVGGATSMLGGLFAGNELEEGYNEVKKMYDKRMSEVRSHRDKVYYEDPTQSAEFQAAATKAREALADEAKRTRATSAVGGGTAESEAVQKQAAAKAVGDMMQKQAVYGASKKEGAYQSAESQLDQFTKYKADARMAQAQGKASAISSATGSLAQGLSSGLDGVGDIIGGKFGGIL